VPLILCHSGGGEFLNWRNLVLYLPPTRHSCQGSATW
jgi:hypothetical protein